MALYDVIVIGAGPAGVTATIYTLRKKLKTLVITQMVGGQAAWTGDIENYPSYQVVTGAELTLKFQEHLKEYDAQLNEGETVTKIEKVKDHVHVTTDKAVYETCSIVIASGKRPRLLNVPGETEYSRRGVNYCAICDGPLFAGKDVAVIGGGNSGLEAVIQMAKISPKIYLIEASEGLSGDPILVEKIKKLKNVEILIKTNVKGIGGEKFVTGIEVENATGNRKIPVGGIFIEIGLIPNSDFVEILEKNEKGEIIVDCACKTSVEGIYAAGDVTNVLEKQIVIAAGEGAKAALSASKFISKNF
ncbi:MAG: FAD-dependent oxidoreductase [Candidatus Altiarchaeota archaeon]